MTGMNRRRERLDWMVKLGPALTVLLPLSLLPSMATAQTARTRTTLTVNAAGRPSATVTAVSDDSAASGIVSFEENGRVLGQSVLNAEGLATAGFTLPAGDHTLQAVYAGGAAYQSSAASQVISTQATTGTPSFQLSLAVVSPSTLPMTLTAGESGSVTVTVTPVNNSALTAPMFVTLSCSGLPSLSSCSFTPEDVEITSTTPTSCASGSAASACPPTSLMTITTQAQTGKLSPGPSGFHNSNPVAWALLLPGILGMGGIAWGARRRRWAQRLTLLALLGLVATLGTTACSPLYNYYNHGPPVTPATPSGNYTVTITAQSSDGVTYISNSTTMVLTVK